MPGDATFNNLTVNNAHFNGGMTTTGTHVVTGTATVNNLNVTGTFTPDTLALSGPLVSTSSDVMQTLVKGAPVVTDNSVFADMLATTQNGRIAIAKALNFGTGSNVFLENNYIPLLSNGYSGKGVLYGHFERAMQFRVPSLRHVVHPQQIFSTTSNSFNALQNTDTSINNPAFIDNAPHVYATSGLVLGFDLHAQLANVHYRQVKFGGYETVDQSALVMGPAYNADLVSIEQFFSDATFYSDNPDQLNLFDDVWVEVMEKAFLRGVKVGQAATILLPTLPSPYSQVDTSGTAFTGVNNPISYIASLAADHDMVYCESAGNMMIQYAPYGSEVQSPGSGYMGVCADARNILSIGTKLINDGTVYPYVSLSRYSNASPNGFTSFDNYVVDKDYAQVNYYVDPTNGHHRPTPAAGYTDRDVACYHGYGRTVDTAGPGETHRLKPDIISAQGSSHQYIYWTADTPGQKYVYAKILNPATSASAPTAAGGVCLLREALPLYDAHQIRECIMLTGSNGDLSDADTDVGLGYGVINLQAALEYGQARPQKAPPSLVEGDWEYSGPFLSNIAAGALNTLNVYQPFNGSNTFTPKSVQSFKCPKDTALYSSNVVYQGAYDKYETSYNTYVASAPSLWTAGVLDLSPPKGLWGTSTTRDISVDGSGPTFNVTSNRSWIAVAEADMQEIKDLMLANGIKICTTSKLLGAFSVLAESPEQLAAVVNGNTKIRSVLPVMKLKIIDDE